MTLTFSSPKYFDIALYEHRVCGIAVGEIVLNEFLVF